MPTVPPSAARDLPPGVAPAAVVWDEIVAGGGSAAKAVARGTVLRLEDRTGDAAVAFLVHNHRMPTERLNVADTVKVQWQAYLGDGAVLLSDLGRAMATVGADTSGCHDALVGPSNRAANERRYGAGGVEGPCPNARDRLAVALGKFGLGRRDVAPAVTWFKGTTVGTDGTLVWRGAPTAPGARVELVAEMDLIVTLAVTPHVLDPRPEYTTGPVRVTAWTGCPTGPDDAQWRSTPERERAYLNTQSWLAGLPA
jgi:urea carboxylase-associated protein 2